MSVTIQQRRDLAANWVTANPVLHSGEIGVETDTEKAKFGDGVTAWNSLGYWNPGNGAVSSVFGRTGAVTAQSGDYTAAEVGADASGAAAAAQSNAEAFATSAVATETTRAETAEGLLIPLAQKAAANGVATLGSGGLVPQAELAPVGSPVPGKYAPLLYGAIWGQPGKFYADSAGCKGDAQFFTDGVMGASSNAVAATSSALFKSSDVGVKAMLVQTGNGAYSALRCGLVTGFTDSAHVTVANSATANTTGTPGAISWFGTPDDTAMAALFADADAYGKVHGRAEVCLDPDASYLLDAAFGGGGYGANYGNCQLALPYPLQAAEHYELLIDAGAEDSCAYPNWAQLVPQVGGGAVIVTTRTDGNTGNNTTTKGPSHVIGGPVNGMGGETGASTGWDNLHLVVKGLNIVFPYNAGCGGLDLFAIASQRIKSLSAFAAAVVPTSSAPSPSLSSASHISNQQGYGLRTASPGNDASVFVESFRAQGLCYALGASEWANVLDAHLMYSIMGIGAYANGIAMSHHFSVRAQIENCTNAMGATDTGTYRGEVWMGTEVIGNHFYDPSNQFQATTVHLRAANSGNSYKAGGFMQSSTGGTGITIFNEMNQPGFIGPPSVPSSGTAFPNYYYSNARVNVQPNGATVTAIAVNGTTLTGITSGIVSVPTGATITLTYSGGTPAWQWELEA
jgi:Major tropism determinant N-terminal domain